MAKKKWSEEDIVYALYRKTVDEGYKYAVPNSTKVLGYTGESDFLAINRKGMIEEFEIKTTNWDFKRDFMDRGNKKRRHEILSELSGLPMMQVKMPNYFYFVAPDNIIPIEEVPAYAGLIIVTEQMERGVPEPYATVVKKAPQLHAHISSDRAKKKFVDEMLFRSMAYSRKLYKLRRNG